MEHIPKIYSFDEAVSVANGNAKNKKCTQRKNLLLGNGFSKAYYEDFGYTTLFEAIKDKKDLEKVKKLFKYLGTSNFEGVLQLLQDSAHTAKIYGLDPKDIDQDYEILKKALAEAITKVHPSDTGQIPDENKRACLQFLKKFESVFTVNYDLLLYWAIMVENPIPFIDFFSREEDTPDEYCEFEFGEKGTPILFLHGALHILQSRGQVYKRVWKTTGKALINQIKVAMDNGKYPLVVTEGESKSKRKQIKENKYLDYVFSKFGNYGGQLFTFGFSFSDQDKHIADEIAKNAGIRYLWIGLRGDFSDENNQKLIEVAKNLKEKRDKFLKKHPPSKKSLDGDLQVLFYDAGSMDIWGKSVESKAL